MLGQEGPAPGGVPDLEMCKPLNFFGKFPLYYHLASAHICTPPARVRNVKDELNSDGPLTAATQ